MSNTAKQNKKGQHVTKVRFPFQLHGLHNMDTCLKELGGRTKTRSGFVDHKLDPTTLSVVLSLVFSLLITQVSEQLTKWKLEHTSIQANSTVFNHFVENVIMSDHRVREINQHRWSQLQAENQKVTWEEFKLYTQYVWGQWARQKSKGIKRTQDAIKAHPIAEGKPVPPSSSTPPKEPTTHRKRVAQVEEQTMTPPSSTKKWAEVHQMKRRRGLSVAPLRGLIHTYMKNGLVSAAELRSYITEIETTLATESSADDESETFNKEGIPLLLNALTMQFMGLVSTIRSQLFHQIVSAKVRRCTSINLRIRREMGRDCDDRGEKVVVLSEVGWR